MRVALSLFLSGKFGKHNGVGFRPLFEGWANNLRIDFLRFLQKYSLGYDIQVSCSFYYELCACKAMCSQNGCASSILMVIWDALVRCSHWNSAIP